MASYKAKRAVAEDLTQEELAASDILTKPGMKLTRIADNQAAAMAQGMLMKLRVAMQVLDWHREQHNRAQLMAGI